MRRGGLDMAETTMNLGEKKQAGRSTDSVDKQLQRIRKNNDELTVLADELEKMAKSRTKAT